MKTRTTRTKTYRLLAALTLLAALPAQAQTYTRTEQITYSDNTTKWVLGQVAQVRCVAPTTALPAGCGASGTEMSTTTYDATTALPLVSTAFGKVQQTLTYNADGTLATVKDGNNNVTTVSNWKRGIPQTIAYADGTGDSAVVNDAGWITSATDENGYTTSYTFDAMGRLASVTYPNGDTPAWNSTTQVFEPVFGPEVGIDSGHWRQTIATGNGRKITYFDALWRPLVTLEYDTANVAGTQRYQRLAYDAEGHTTFTSYPGTVDSLSTGTRTVYDSLGRPTTVTQDSELSPSLLTTTTEYLSGFQTRTTTPRGTQTTTAYMAFDQPSTSWPVSIIQPEGAYTDISRDVFGKPTAITRHTSDSSTTLTRSYAYNGNQELCRTVEPEIGATLSGYDGAGNLSWSAAGLPGTQGCEADGTSSAVAPRKVNRTYDTRNRLTALGFPDGQGNQSWTYTPDGLPASVATSNPNVANPITTSYGYNHRRLLASESVSIAGTTLATGYGFDSNGHVSSQTYPSGLAVAYAPNALGQPTQAGSFATGVSYYPNGSIQQFSYGNGIVHTMTQNARQLPGRSTDAGTSDLSYGYDANANVNQITDNLGGRQTRGMSYDNLDRLTQATSSMWGTANYGYDVLDNITHAQVGASDNYAARDQYYCYANNLLTSIKSGSCSGTTVTTLSYDAQGNLSNKNGQGYTFDYGNRLRNVPGKEWYAYDGQGRRVLSCNAGACDYQQYTEAGQPIYSQDNRSGKIAERIYLQGSLVAIRETPTGGGAVVIKYQHIDSLGSPIATTDANKAIIEKTEYEPYGTQTNRVLTDGPNYTGHILDASTGMVYMQQRYYDPLVGRFLSIDPVAIDVENGKEFGLYTYVGNSPYARVDPDGQQMIRVIIAAVRALAKTEAKQAAKQTAKEIEKKEAQGLSQRAAAREAKRQADIPTSQQPVSQTNGRVTNADGQQVSVGRQQTYETPKPGGGTETKSVQISRDVEGKHAGQPQVEAGRVKAGGQTDSAGRPRIQNEGKVRVDIGKKADSK